MTKTGFIAIVGRPNVGKSTLLNALLGEKVAIVSKKPQTTRNRITGILTQDENQFVFLDTPGMHKPKTKLGDRMVETVRQTVRDVDATILVVEAGAKMGEVEASFLSSFRQSDMPAILVINKTDKSNAGAVAQTITEYAKEYAFASVVPISALKKDGIELVKKECEAFLQESPWYFPSDAMTDQPERQIVAEVIREKILRTMEDEIPHGTAVVIEEFKEEKKILRIRAEIYCERESHKRMLIGKNGVALKTIGTYAREDLEAFFGVPVYLNLWIKVKERWRDSDTMLNHLGFRNED
jgi:GTP-binding protein Era